MAIKLSAQTPEVSYAKPTGNPFEEIRAQLEAYPEHAVLPLPYDARSVALAALVVAETIDRTDAKLALAKFAQSGAFDLRSLEILAPSARAVLYILSRRREETAEHIEELVEDAMKLRAKMLRVLDYHLDNERGVMALLDRMKNPETLNLVSDLEKLADAYSAYDILLANDRRRYRLDDSAKARVLARALRENPPITFEHQDWAPWLRRAWTALATAYADVCRAARYLFEDAESQRRFELLAQIPRTARSRSAWLPEGGLAPNKPRPSRAPGAMPSGEFTTSSPRVTAPVPSPTPAGSELRTNDRFEVELAVTLHSESNFYTGLVENLSESGVFVATHQAHPLGTLVDVSLTLPDSREPLWLRGEVRWVRKYRDSLSEPPGMGIRFIDLAASDEERIGLFLGKRTPIYHEP
jgi:type IV pilus assembly protein PilZ